MYLASGIATAFGVSVVCVLIALVNSSQPGQEHTTGKKPTAIRLKSPSNPPKIATQKGDSTGNPDRMATSTMQPQDKTDEHVAETESLDRGALELKAVTAFGAFEGLSDISKLRASSNARLERGYASPFGNSLGALCRILKSLPDNVRADRATQILADLRAGRFDSQDVRDFRRFPDSADLMIAESIGMPAHLVARELYNEQANRRCLVEEQLAGTILLAQRDEFEKQVLRRIFSPHTTRLVGDYADQDAEAAHEFFSVAVPAVVISLPPEELGNSSLRYTAIARELESRLVVASNSNPSLTICQRNMANSPGGIRGCLARHAMVCYGAADQALAGTLADTLVTLSPAWIDAQMHQK